MAVSVAWLIPARSHIIAAVMCRRMRASFTFCPKIANDLAAFGNSNVLFGFMSSPFRQ